MTKRIAAAVLALWATAPMARELDLNLHNEAAEIGYYVQPEGEAFAEGTDVGGSFYFNEGGDLILSGLFHALMPPAEGFSPWQFGAGVKGYALALDRPDETAGALALSGSARASIPAELPQAVVLRAHIAPAITAFGEADRLLDATARYRVELNPQVSGYLGYRYLQVDVDSGRDRSLEHNFHVGVGLRF
ncbi:MAG: YfaZ family outer membrane protein [Halorhodospira sp.]